MTVQFSGGEPTISPIFLDAVRYAKQVGYFSVQAATNGIRFAQDPEFARQAREAGLRIAYLQFDGVTEEANAHRKVGNLFDVKLRAIENLYAAGIDVCLVVTIVNTVNNDQVGPIVKFALQNCDKISFVSFQPVSFTGRDEDITTRSAHAQRYTLSHLAEDVKRQTGVTEPLRDWFPLSASSVMSDVTDLLKGPGADWGTLKCGCHPDCGIGTGFMVSKKTKEWAPLSAFFNVERVLQDAVVIADAARGPFLTKVQTALSLLRNYSPTSAPNGFRLVDLVQKFDKQSGGQLGGRLGARDNGNRKHDEWLLLFVAGMWFQDLWTYDFRRTEMCIIPYATQMGEISFCAYNTGVGWRQIVENMYQNATVAEWYRDHGKHPVFANPRKTVPLPADAQPISLHIPRDGRLIQWAPKSQPARSPGHNRHRHRVGGRLIDIDRRPGDHRVKHEVGWGRDRPARRDGPWSDSPGQDAEHAESTGVHRYRAGVDRTRLPVPAAGYRRSRCVPAMPRRSVPLVARRLRSRSEQSVSRGSEDPRFGVQQGARGRRTRGVPGMSDRSARRHSQPPESGPTSVRRGGAS